MTNIATLYARYIALYGEMEAPNHANGEAATDELCNIESAIAALPAATQAECNLKSVIATLAERGTNNGLAIMASLTRDYQQAA